MITKQSEFNRFAKLLGEDTIDIQPGEVKVVEFKKSKFGHTEKLLEQTISLTSGETLIPEGVISSRALPTLASYYVVSGIKISKGYQIQQGKSIIMYGK